MQYHAERFADRLVASTMTLLTRDFNRFLSLVIVNYGTGIRVAAPTSVLSSMTSAARTGILIKSGGHLEKLAEVDTVVFDKTGTLSHGCPHVVDVLSYDKHINPDHLMALAVAVETKLQHPVAEALREVRELNVQLPPCDETHYRIGLGVEGRVNGYYMHVGSERFLHDSIKVDHVAADRAGIDERGCPPSMSESMASLRASLLMRIVSGRKAASLLSQRGNAEADLLRGDRILESRPPSRLWEAKRRLTAAPGG